MEKLRFKTPPVIDAFIGITFPQVPSLSITTVQGAANGLAKLGYSQHAPVESIEFVVEAGENGVPSSRINRDVLGERYFSSDRRYSTQFLLTGFVFNQSGSYDTWETFTDEAKKLFAKYVELTGDRRATAFGVRYVNRLVVPSDTPLEDFVRVFVSLPPDMPQGVSAQSLEVVIPLEEGIQLRHSQRLLPHESDPKRAIILLDNDFQFSPCDIASEKLWERIDGVRSLKNEFFDKMLTKKMKDEFDA